MLPKFRTEMLATKTQDPVANLISVLRYSYHMT
jgi:hypothetical protein